MSEFQEKLQIIKDSVSEYKNPALMSSDDLYKEEEQEVPQEESSQGFADENNDEEHEQEVERKTSQRNDKGHRRKKTFRDRYNQVFAENKAKDIQLQQSMAYIQEQERRLAELQEQNEQSAHYSNIYYEDSLDNEKKRVLTELEFAEETGDIKKKIELQDQLSEINAKRESLLFSKSLPKQRQQYQPQYQDPRYYASPPINNSPPLNENYEYFLEENPWADPNSPDFDQDLYNEADELASKLNKGLKINNGSDIIGTAEYFNVITKEMRNRYGINSNNNSDDNYETSGPEYDNQSYNNIQHYEVAPVTKKGTSMADRYIANRRPVTGNGRPRMALSQDEEDISRGVTAVLNQIHRNSTGKQISDEEGRAIYYETKIKQPWRR